MFAVRHRFDSLRETINDYPLVSIALFVMTGVSWAMIWGSDIGLSDEMFESLSKFLLVLFVYVCGALALAKTFVDDKKRRYLWQGVFFLVIVGYYFLLPASPDSMQNSLWIRHALFQGVAVATLLVAPTTGIQRSKQTMYTGLIHLLLHGVLAAIFSLALGAGISGALASIEALFGVGIAGEWYPTIFVGVGILFGGLSFVDGVRQWNITEKSEIAQVKRKTLLGRVIGVLLVLYGLILYMYLGKILVTGEWPSNQVSPLGFAFSAFVVLASLLLVPVVVDRDNDRKRQSLLQWMYILLLPVIGMIIFAITMRVQQYGVTEMRYLVYMLLVWLLLSAGYMIFAKEKDLWYVLAIFTVLGGISFAGGPISAGGAAKHYQQNIMQNLIEQHAISLGADGKILDVEALDDEVANRLSSTIEYLVEYHGPVAVSGLLETNEDSGYRLVESLGLKRQSKAGSRTYMNMYRDNNPVRTDISSYDMVFGPVALSSYRDASPVEKDGMVFFLDGQDIVMSSGEGVERFDFASVMLEYTEGEPMFYVFSGNEKAIHVDYANGYQEDGIVKIESVKFDLYMKSTPQ